MDILRAKLPIPPAARPQPASSPPRTTLGFQWHLRTHTTPEGDLRLSLSVRRATARHAHMLHVHVALRHPAADALPLENLFVHATPAPCPDLTRRARLLFPPHVAAERMSFRPFPTRPAAPLRRRGYVKDGFVVLLLTLRAVPLAPPRGLARRGGAAAAVVSRERHGGAGEILWLDQQPPGEHLWPLRVHDVAETRFASFEGFHTDISSYTETFEDEVVQLVTDVEDTSVSVSYNLSSLLAPNFDTQNEGDGSFVGASSFWDVQLHAGYGDHSHCFYLHRCILALASPIFRSMLTVDMKERSSGRIELSHFSPESVSYAVRHIYGEDISALPCQYAFETYSFGHQFEVPSLMSAARISILENISTASVINVLCFGRTYGDNVLVDKAHSYISHNFSTMASDSNILDKLCVIPADAMYRLLESDCVRATELEILLVSLRWLGKQRGDCYPDGILRRIRWSLMTPQMFDVALSANVASLSQNFHKIVELSRPSIGDNGRPLSIFQRRRFLGRPTAAVWIPLTRRPPRVAKRRYSDGQQEGYAEMRTPCPSELQECPLKQVETTFEYADLKWGFRVQMLPCGEWGCDEPRLSVSLWLEEDDDGSLWTTDGTMHTAMGILPLRVSARVMLWNARGGQLHSRALNVDFRSAGWACGWSIQDLLDGHERTSSFMSQLSNLSAEESGALQVAVEICECSPVPEELRI